MLERFDFAYVCIEYLDKSILFLHGLKENIQLNNDQLHKNKNKNISIPISIIHKTAVHSLHVSFVFIHIFF